MKKKILLIAMMLVIVLTGTVTAYADDGGGDGIMPLDTNIIHFSTHRTSATTANVVVNITFSDVVDKYNVVIYLQKKVNGEWKQDSTNPEYVFYNNSGNKDEFIFSNVYTHLEDGVNYRIWCVSKDYIDGVSHITNGYSNQF